jgi:hypothetical protein
MKTFRDTTGRAWDLAVTIGTLKRIRSRLSVDLFSMHLGTPSLAERLVEDVALQVDAIFICIEPQARAAGVTDEQWAESMGGDAMAAAVDAFWEELIGFFLASRPGTAELARAARTAVRTRQLTSVLVAEAMRTTPGEPSTGSPGSHAAEIPPA